MPQEKDIKIKRKWYAAIAGAVLVLLVAVFFISSNGDENEYVKAIRGDIAQVVRITGRVAPSNDASLAFEKAGRVSYIKAGVGERVSAGDLLIAIDSSDVAAEIAQFQATVKAEEAKLAELQRGSTLEQLAVYQTKLASALTAVENGKKTAADAIPSAFTAVDDAIHNKIDPMFTNPRTSTPGLNLIVEGQLKSAIENSRVTVEGILQKWPIAEEVRNTSTPASGLTATTSNTIAAPSDDRTLLSIITTKNSLIEIRAFVDLTARAINLAVPSAQVSQTAIDTYKAAVLAARTNINTAITTLTTAEEGLRNAIAAVNLARSELALASTPARAEEVAAQQARVEQAKANVANAEARFAKTRLFSPIDGVITEKAIELGEITAINKVVLKVIATDAFKIEANVPESEIANVKSGNKAEITLDAYPEIQIEGAVMMIDPAEILVDGVPTYKVTIKIGPTTAVVRSGMTANIRIVTVYNKGVITVPYRAITMKDNVAYVNLLNDEKKTTETKVELGLRDDEGMVEIVSGLSEGATVVMPITK